MDWCSTNSDVDRVSLCYGGECEHDAVSLKATLHSHPHLRPHWVVRLRTCWRAYISRLTWEDLVIPRDELKAVAGLLHSDCRCHDLNR